MQKLNMIIQGKEYRTNWFENNVVKIIDQTKLPHQFTIKDLEKVNDAIAMGKSLLKMVNSIG